jgi:VIT1/CCC1 family predicted Fe2+/Mn2+ transporter
MSRNPELHKIHRSSWLRAAVLGANDGLISTSSLIVGVAAANSGRESVTVAAFAGLIAGALSMAAGEYVSVSSQSDIEAADIERERVELESEPDLEHAELAGIYRARGLSPALARQVADQLTAHDALAAHARDELGFTDFARARPMQAAIASAAAFATGAAPPVLLTTLLPLSLMTTGISGSTLVLLAVLGAAAARLGGASLWRGAARVMFWGVLAMVCTALVGSLFGSSVHADVGH